MNAKTSMTAEMMTALPVRLLRLSTELMAAPMTPVFLYTSTTPPISITANIIMPAPFRPSGIERSILNTLTGVLSTAW